ncbi:hypothetical protein [Solibacillus sp. FSL H8-0538]|uniref:hypothetical protein n=1 Tax=Solibacillus sp. FSL H8-0538 TaxID=2921400 RepID=UPI0030F888B5
MKVPLILLEREPKSVHIMATLHYERRQRALRDAYKLFQQAEQKEHELVHPSLPLPKEKKITRTKKQSIGEQLALFDQQTLDELKWIRGPKLRKRFVSQLSIRDIGETRLVMGEFVNIELVGQVAVLTVAENNQYIAIVFDRSFIEESFNRQYLNNFYVLQPYIGKPFTGVGIIRPGKDIGELYCSIQYGTDFRVDNLNLVEIAYKG